MSTLRRSLLVLALTSLGCGCATAAAPATRWEVRASEGFDALCALNLLSGDPYYLDQYRTGAEELATPRYAAARRAAARLKRVLKDGHGEIPSAFLTLMLSGGPDSTLAAVLDGARHPERLEGPFRASPYASEDAWALFLEVRPTLVEALEAMRRAGFARDWRRHLAAGGVSRAAELRTRLARYDVLGEQERLVGHALQDGRIEVVLLWYSRPHGIRVQGARFLTNVGYPLEVVLRNAAHEPLHPPCDRADAGVAAALDSLARDPLVQRIVRDHDPAFGYRTLEGYLEEDAVQALEQVVSERLGFAAPAAERWRQSDGGMHLLAAALYQRMRASGFAERGGVFARWLADAAHEGALGDAAIARAAREVVGADAVARWDSTAARRAGP